MPQITTLDKVNAGKSRSESKVKMLAKRLFRPVMKAIAQSQIEYKLLYTNHFHALPEKPVIFAFNHSESNDCPIASICVNNNSYFLMAKQKLEPIEEWFFNAIGSIFVDRTDKEDCRLCKEAMAETLQKGKSLIIFPEGTWNLSENELMLPMKWGIVDVALKANAQVIPVILEYDREKHTCLITYGEPIIFDPEVDKRNAIEDLRSSMATIRFLNMENRPIVCRANMDFEKEKIELNAPTAAYKNANSDFESEMVFRPYTSTEEAFAHLKSISPNTINSFLFNKRNHD